jgi:general stress protein YciG
MARPRSRRQLTPEDEQQIFALFREGLPLVEIGLRVHRRWTTVAAVIDRLGCQRPPLPSGFAAMDPAQQRALASRGGKASHAAGTAHEFTHEEAVAAGAKGGKASHAKGVAHQFTTEEARTAGRKGGRKRTRQLKK